MKYVGRGSRPITALLRGEANQSVGSIGRTQRLKLRILEVKLSLSSVDIITGTRLSQLLLQCVCSASGCSCSNAP